MDDGVVVIIALEHLEQRCLNMQMNVIVEKQGCYLKQITDSLYI